MEWYEILISVLAGIATAIPLIVELVKYIQKAIKEKNWSAVIQLVMNLMKEAEGKFEEGADKKVWVLSMLKASANSINYDIDMDVIGELIDAMCSMSKIVNAPNTVTE